MRPPRSARWTGIALIACLVSAGALSAAPPKANPQSVTTPFNTAIAITLTGSPNNLRLNFGIINSPTHGVLTGSAPNVLYTPTAGFAGSDSFTFIVNDGTVDSAAATVGITVSPPAVPTA